MVQRNQHIAKLNAGYLFPEINKRKQAVLAKNPEAKLISLGIGDTTQPLDPFVTQWMVKYSQELSTLQGYSGYGPEQGNRDIRQRIAEKFYPKSITSEDVFVSDGAKCDIGRLQLLFGANATIAVQDPTYPVYVDTGVILGQSPGYNRENAQYQGIIYMRCTPENDFFPDLEQLPRTDLIYFCSPNNPTGSVAAYEQLEKLVKFAKQNRSIIIYDAAYSSFIRNGHFPKSIYEVDGASEVAIEVNSFSKMAGFTGVRLGWSIVPEKLCFDDGSPVRNDWHRINTTFFNGASNVAQKAGLAVLADEGMFAVDRMVDYYMQNALKIRTALSELGFASYGGVNAPFVWGKFPGKNSWEMFADILENAHVVTTPGSGFGPAGESFLRFSAFGQRAHVDEALERLKKYFIKK